MPDIQTLKDNFAKEMSACRDLYNHCLSPRALHTDAGVEAAFLQMQTAWEAFLEEIFLAFLCGSQPLTGENVFPHFTVINTDIARTVLYQGQQYADWAKIDTVILRLHIYFDPNQASPQRFEAALNTVKRELKEIADIRNYIAHSSNKAREAFEKVCLRYLSSPIVSNIGRASDFLTAKQKKSSETYFDFYISTLEATAIQITG